MITRSSSDPVGLSGHRSRFERPEPELEHVDGPALVIGGDGAQGRVLAIPVGWSRIGRSHSAEIRLADPSVSRRHAVIVRGAEGSLQVIDDRSLTGVRVNGEPVTWAELHNGDELTIGRVRLVVALGSPTLH